MIYPSCCQYPAPRCCWGSAALRRIGSWLRANCRRDGLAGASMSLPRNSVRLLRHNHTDRRRGALPLRSSATLGTRLVRTRLHRPSTLWPDAPQELNKRGTEISAASDKPQPGRHSSPVEPSRSPDVGPRAVPELASQVGIGTRLVPRAPALQLPSQNLVQVP